MHPLEEKIGYKFRNSLLLAEALTHSSLGHETQKVHFDNQRLEYLGDAVLQLVSGEHLFRLFPDVDEGHLSKFRSRLVSGRALAQYASRLGLGDHLMMGRGDENNGGRRRASTLADAFESLVGAMYLDGGLEVVQAFVLAQASEHLDSLYEEPSVEINPKGHLQEILQSRTASWSRPGRITPGPSRPRSIGTGSRSAAARAPASNWRKAPPRWTPCTITAGAPLPPRADNFAHGVRITSHTRR